MKNNLTIEIFNADGTLAEQETIYYDDLIADHKNHRCNFLCPFCYAEAMETLEN